MMFLFRKILSAKSLRRAAIKKRKSVTKKRVLLAYKQCCKKIVDAAENGEFSIKLYPAKYYEYETACRLFSRLNKGINVSWKDVYIEDKYPEERVEFVFDWSK